MHRLLTTLGRGFKERIGWKRLGIAASLLIITLRSRPGAHPQRRQHRRDSGCAHRLPLTHVVLAAFCVIGAFCTLTFYDFFALRTSARSTSPIASQHFRASPAIRSATTSAPPSHRGAIRSGSMPITG